MCITQICKQVTSVLSHNIPFFTKYYEPHHSHLGGGHRAKFTPARKGDRGGIRGRKGRESGGIRENQGESGELGLNNDGKYEGKDGELEEIRGK